MDNSKGKKSMPFTYDVFVGHVPKTLPKGKLEEIFCKYGVLVDVLYRHGNGSYGYAIVKFKFQKDADAVLSEISRVTINGWDMEVKRGKMSSQGYENMNFNGSPTMVKTVTFAEPYLSIPSMENAHFVEPVLYDPNCTYLYSENNQIPGRVDVICTSVENSMAFYGCVMERYEELLSLSMKLNGICPNLEPVIRKPALKRVYAALYEDNAWYRCSVIQCTVPSQPGVCIVQYIDYGNIAQVSYSNIVEIPEQLRIVKPFAVRCVFSNNGNPHIQKKISFLHHFINKRLILHVLPVWGKQEFQVFSCTCFETGLDVIAELGRNGSAMPQTYMSAMSSQPNRSNIHDKVMNAKQEKAKPKKSNGNKSHKKAKNNTNKKEEEVFSIKKQEATTTNGETCNGVVKFSSEINNNEKVLENVKIQRKLSNESQQGQDFIPKKIIQRGSAITNVVNCDKIASVNIVNVPGMEKLKSEMLKLDCVIANLKIINNIRSVFPLHTDDDLIDKAINLLQNGLNLDEAIDAKRLVEEAYQKYWDSLKNLKECSDQELLMDLKEQRKIQRAELHSQLAQFLEKFDDSLLEKRKKIQEIIISLESNSNAWMNVYLSQFPETLEDLLSEYNQEKEKRKDIIQRARKNTNEKFEKFHKFLGDLQKEFTLNMGDGPTEESCTNSIAVKGFWTLKLEEALTELNISLEAEDKASKMVKDRNQVSVIECILEKLDIPKEKIDAECDFYEKYKGLFEDLNYTSDLSVVFEELYALKKDIQAMSSNFVFNGDLEKTNNVLMELHSALLKESSLLENLAKAYSCHFPELVLEHPSLKLDEYQKNSYLLKHSWNKSFFPLFEECKRIEPCYISRFAGEPVVIKECEISDESEKKAFVKKAVMWNEIRSKSLVKMKGLFTNKDESILYAVLPPVWKTLWESPLSVPVNFKKAVNLLQQILIGLCDIHSRGIAHGAVHPAAILHDDEEVLLDFNFDKKYLQGNFCLNGINFQVPNAEDVYKSADMYGFGCLVIWVLFPNLSFNSTDQGVPNLNAFQSIIQDVLSARDFASLSALLNTNQDLRPSSRVLLSNGFLKKLRIISEDMS